MKKTLILTLALLSAALTWGADTRVSSPDGRMVVTIHTNADQLSWEVAHDGVVVLTPSVIDINGALRKMKCKMRGSTAIAQNGKFSVEFRADNDAAA